jgi:hypothetical protein
MITIWVASKTKVLIMTNKKTLVNIYQPLERFDKYSSPSDYHLNKDELVLKVHDNIKLWEIHGKHVSIDLAISHLLNLKQKKYRV